MSSQPPNNDNRNQFDAEFEAIENSMNSILQGAFSSMFRQLIDSSIFENPENNGFSGVNSSDNSITAVFNGRNVNSRAPVSTVIEEDSYGGNDFKRLAMKSRENRGVVATTEGTNKALPSDEVASYPPAISSTMIPSSVGRIFNLFVKQPLAEIFKRPSFDPLRSNTNSSNHHDKPDENQNGGGGSWSFTSTSSRTIYRPDGTQETIITKKSNGVTETIKQIRYPDGRIVEE